MCLTLPQVISPGAHSLGAMFNDVSDSLRLRQWNNLEINCALRGTVLDRVNDTSEAMPVEQYEECCGRSNTVRLSFFDKLQCFRFVI
jgi:hypothetical protein